MGGPTPPNSYKYVADQGRSLYVVLRIQTHNRDTLVLGQKWVLRANIYWPLSPYHSMVSSCSIPLYSLPGVNHICSKPSFGVSFYPGKVCPGGTVGNARENVLSLYLLFACFFICKPWPWQQKQQPEENLSPVPGSGGILKGLKQSPLNMYRDARSVGCLGCSNGHFLSSIDQCCLHWCCPESKGKISYMLT